MYLAIVLYCAIPTDAETCNILVRKNHLFRSEIVCQKEIEPIAKWFIHTGHYVKTRCFEFNPFGEEI
jgi:hypothetical protein